MKVHETLPIVPIARGEGAWLVDFDGSRYLDAVSSWWVNLFGHSNARIKEAIRGQLDTLPHAMLAGFTHRPVVELSERLHALTGLGHAFYGSDGASATEIALKMSFHYWRNRGHADKRSFVSLAGGYHGETMGALAVTDVAIFRDVYAPLLASNVCVPSPVDDVDAAAAALDAHLARHHATTAALIVEPLVQGAAGMRMYDPALSRARARDHRASWRASHRRRDHDGIRPHGHDVRVGAVGRAAAGLHVPVQGHHRRLPSAVVRAGERRHLRRVLRRRRGARLPAFAFVHRQSARVRRGARRARHLPRRRRDCAQPRARREWAGALRRSSRRTDVCATFASAA